MRRNSAVTVSLWKDEAENFIDFGQPVFLINGGKINEFGGQKYISIVDITVVKRNPDLPETNSLRNWFNSGGR